MSTRYKLTYFPLMALGEPIRYMLSYTGKQFLDVRIDPNQWPQIKTGTPFGKVPVLEDGDKKFHQSAAICRYLGSQAGLAGSTPIQSLYIDMRVDSFTDFRQNIAAWWQEEDHQRRKEMKKRIINETLPYYMEKFDKIIEENGGFIANNSLSWGDLYIVSLLDMVRGILKTEGLLSEDKYPNIIKLERHVKEIPNIKKWIQSRPTTEF